MDFEKLLKAWQQQPAQVETDIQQTAAEQQQILAKVKKLQRQLLYSNILGTCMIVAYAVLFKVLWMRSFGDTVLAKTGMVLLFLGLGLSSWVNWLKSLPWNRAHASLSSKDFLVKSIKGFQFILHAQRVYVPLFYSVFGLGLHLMLFSSMEENALVHRILAHVGITVLFLMVAAIGIYHQKLVYQEKYAPTVQALEEQLQELEREEA